MQGTDLQPSNSLWIVGQVEVESSSLTSTNPPFPTKEDSMTKPVMGACLRPRVCIGSSETLAVQVAVCPKCKEKVRLMWPGFVLQIPAHRVVYFECPLCSHSFSLLAFDLVSLSEGGEQYAAAEVCQLS